MKNIKLILLFVFMAIAIKANATQYIKIKNGFYLCYRLIYVSKPMNLKDWYYDSKNDIYYWVRGEPVEFKYKMPMTSAIKTNATQYVIIKAETFGSGSFRFIYISKPTNLKKWYYDSKTDIYYRGKAAFGIPMKIKAKISTS